MTREEENRSDNDDESSIKERRRLRSHRHAIRSLRRRFRKALLEEDAATALRAYTATMADYEAWLEEEKEAERQRILRQQEEEERKKREAREMQREREAGGMTIKKESIIQHKKAFSKRMGNFLRSTRANLRAVDDMTHVIHERCSSSGGSSRKKNSASSNSPASPDSGGVVGLNTGSLRNMDIPPQRSNRNLLCPCPQHSTGSESSVETDHEGIVGLAQTHLMEGGGGGGGGGGEDSPHEEQEHPPDNMDEDRPGRERMVSVDLVDASGFDDVDYDENAATAKDLKKHESSVKCGLLEMEMNPSMPFEAEDESAFDDNGSDSESEMYDSGASDGRGHGKKGQIEAQKKKRIGKMQLQRKNQGGGDGVAMAPPRFAGLFAFAGMAGGGSNQDFTSGGRGRGRRSRNREDDSGGVLLSLPLTASLPDSDDGTSDHDDDEGSKPDEWGDKDMTTPLHLAARIGSGDLVRLLLSRGGDPNVRDGMKRTALHMAAGGLTDAEEALLIAVLAKGACHKETVQVLSNESKTQEGPYNGKFRKGSASVSVAVSSKSEAGASDSLDSKAQSAPSAKDMFGPGIGIRSSRNFDEENNSEITAGVAASQVAGAKVVRAAMGRFFKQAIMGVKASKDQKDGSDHGQETKKRQMEASLSEPNYDELNRRISDRMDAVLAILTWGGGDDPSSDGGPSINSVDSRGRTALHYAAELGRSEICTALLSAFGIVLTLIDDSGRTPCELAGERDHAVLAAQLEARAVLYTDPYGMDDELMASILMNEDWDDDSLPDLEEKTSEAAEDSTTLRQRRRRRIRRNLVPPFSWFETWTIDDVDAERNKRTNECLKKLRDAIGRVEKDEAMKELVLDHNRGKNDDDSSPDEKNDSCEDELKTDTEGAVEVISQEGHSSDDDQKVADKDMPTTETVKGDEERIVQSESAAVSSSSPSDATSGIGASVVDLDSEEGNTGGKERQLTVVTGGTNVVSTVTTSSDAVGGGHASLACGCDESETSENSNTSRKAIEVSVSDDEAREPAENDFEQSAKTEEVVVDVAVMPCQLSLSSVVNESHAAQLLIYHNWKIGALGVIEKDPIKAIEAANITVREPFSSTHDKTKEPVADNGGLSHRDEPNTTELCLICCEEYATDSPEWVQLEGCEHSFCSNCLGDYIAEAARSRKYGVTLTCPHHECNMLLSQSELKTLAPDSTVYDSLVRTADENFISSAHDLRFCPHPGCTGVVKRNAPKHILSANFDEECIDYAGAVCTMISSFDEDFTSPCTYEGVCDRAYTDIKRMSQPIRAHRFCFACGEQSVHWPATCEVLEKWRDKIAEEIGEIEQPGVDGKGSGADSGEKFEDLAHRLWIKANTRPCPKCKAPIEKNDGCNHMICTNRHCRHEFCWICRKDWKLHNTKTGGYFRCNRWQEEEDHDFYDTPPPPQQRTPAPNTDPFSPSNLQDQTYGSALHSARVARKKARAMARFIHHYSRWIAHGESAALERKMADTVCARLTPVVQAAKEFSGDEHFDFGGKGLSFVHAAFTELLECRSFLRNSYAFAFFRYPKSSPPRFRIRTSKEREKMAFEALQSELEMLTEQMSDIVARSHLRATQTQIMFLTKAASDKRREISNLLISVIHDERRKAKARLEKEKREQLAMKNDPGMNASGISGGEPAVNQRPSRTIGDILHDQQNMQNDVAADLSNLIGNVVQLGLRDDMADALRTRGALLNEQLFPEGQEIRPPDDSADDDDSINGRQRESGEEQLERAEEDEVERAIQASIREHMALTDAALEDSDEEHEDEEDRWADWSCGVCTYMNAGGRRCAMCGTPRGA